MLFWSRPDVLEQLLPNVDLAGIQRVRERHGKPGEHPNFRDLPALLEALPAADHWPHKLAVELDEDEIIIGAPEDLNDDQRDRLLAVLQRLHPWRKGPFRLFGVSIDAEWRSNLKWDRIRPAVGELRGRRVLDVGCGNGYYMFRIAAHQPRLVVGLDPSIAFYFAFELMQRFLCLENLQYERLGHQHLELFDGAFDVALCMGVLYHHPDPIGILRRLRGAIRIGGMAVIESQTVPGGGTTALFPKDRYAKARNVFFVPTRDCLLNWVQRAGFRNVELVDHTQVTDEEQRATSWMTFESLADFLDPHDPQQTVEGYPAPYRTVVRGERTYK